MLNDFQRMVIFHFPGMSLFCRYKELISISSRADSNPHLLIRPSLNPVFVKVILRYNVLHHSSI